MQLIDPSNPASSPATPRRVQTGGFRALLGHDVHPAVQFIKYGVVGGLATGIHVAAFFICGLFLFPCLTENDIIMRLFGHTAPAISETARAWNAGLCNVIAFAVSNTACYFLNRLFVFKPGRHHWALEFLFFFGVSGISLAIGTACQTFLITHQGVQTTYAFGANLVSSLLINYVMRKFIIFKG